MLRIACLIFGLVLTATAAKADQELQTEIQSLLDQVMQIYAADPNGSRTFFDEHWLKDDNIVYQSEQFVNVFYGYDQVAAYWKPSWNTLYGYRAIYSDLQVTRITDDIAIATYESRYDMHAVTRTPLAGWTRISLVLRKQDDEWKIQQYYETPMSLLSQARRIHEEALTPDFADFARSQNPQYDEFVAADASIRARKESPPWAPRPPFRPPAWTTGSGAQE
jgi:ketosteroid isomerase-like protein